MKNVNASIITIGDELLIGQVIDTNSAWIAQQLNKIGVAVKRRIAVGDSAVDIVDILDEESKYSDIILMTGGLGPTSDDITKNVLCNYFGGKMVVNEGALKNVKYLFEQVFKRPISEVNLRQAEVPDVCEVIQNKRGSAPGMIFNKGRVIYISMPGVPYEMKGIMEEAVIPLLKEKFKLPVIVHRTMLTAGIGESALAEIIKDFEDELPAEIKLAYLPTYGMVRLRLSTSGFDKNAVEENIDKYFNDLKLLAKDYLVTDLDEPMQVVVGKLLKEKNKTVSTAESCTGGYVAHLITSVAGSSKYYEGSIVSYSYNVKESVLGVHGDTLNTLGAVSEQTVVEMLKGLLGKLNTDYGVAISGIMGPDGGTEDKPVGTVWMAVGNKEDYQTQKINLRFSRERNIEVTGMMALNFLRKFILAN
ncbi:CinA family nicotinamide mononucleotide deamidase-related protein [Ginsengibacter hankyongi]|uniref:CinA-like protein n=1 Tax=Ginsengibacter hankyongi TaxID=2607284 RepID=A0A5J5IHZ9_9BACT|nr:CinA family nicotinamide mononucleotide deamidase-related protein [Ginsengibacter hankyongi]KAA9040506.1 CinA family nicotinamide mononucleotide deamidase-related protein [Ginsengibacter hankyongi]